MYRETLSWKEKTVIPLVFQFFVFVWRITQVMTGTSGFVQELVIFLSKECSFSLSTPPSSCFETGYHCVALAILEFCRPGWPRT